jgi:Electron transfer DM13
LTRFRTSPGPDLRVRPVPGHADPGDVRGNRDLGGLKGNIGDQQYDLPAGAPRGTLVIWCRAFSATFDTAQLKRS